MAVGVSALLPTATDAEWVDGPRFMAAFEATAPGKKVEDLMTQVDKDFAEFAPVLKITTGGKTLMQHLQEMQTAVAK